MAYAHMGISKKTEFGSAIIDHKPYRVVIKTKYYGSKTLWCTYSSYWNAEVFDSTNAFSHFNSLFTKTYILSDVKL